MLWSKLQVVQDFVKKKARQSQGNEFAERWGEAWMKEVNDDSMMKEMSDVACRGRMMDELCMTKEVHCHIIIIWRRRWMAKEEDDEGGAGCRRWTMKEVQDAGGVGTGLRWARTWLRLREWILEQLDWGWESEY
jgi:hypothetical protein